jgi:hypothetical protein
MSVSLGDAKAKYGFGARLTHNLSDKSFSLQRAQLFYKTNKLAILLRQ